MQLSFGMIFSIILIIAFVAFAFYAIKIFLNTQKTAKIGAFVENLQNDLNDMWKASIGTQKVIYELPSEVKLICFEDKGDIELYFYTKNDRSEMMENIAIVKMEHVTIGTSDKRCFSVTNNKVTISLEKKFGEDLVTIKTA